jgi:SAM-dependent methyltransferase
MVDRHNSLVREPLPITFSEFDGTRLPLADGSIDLAVSKSALEHVRLRDVVPLVRDLSRVLAPGGAMVHAIDLRDHNRICGDEVMGDWLDALRYPRWLFDAMFARRSTSINRLREPEWREIFEAVGFKAVAWERVQYPLPGGFRRDSLRRPWRDYDANSLATGYLHVALHKPL